MLVGLADVCVMTDQDYDAATCADIGGIVTGTPAPTGIPPGPFCPQGVDILTGQCVATNGNFNPSNPTITSFPTGNTPAQNQALLQALEAIINAGNRALFSGTVPVLIPGTNNLYNPATGAITTAIPSVHSVASATSSLIPIAALAVAGVFLVMMMGRR